MIYSFENILNHHNPCVRHANVAQPG
ncbi:uncharacterized protein METZ01_LOCUS258067 [marine metagenome]|uniref:Uncharacterized protein n=1 Tax=marine metagenome TaxID=408172 RepID=A0A382J2A7_9ZZZZ